MPRINLFGGKIHASILAILQQGNRQRKASSTQSGEKTQKEIYIAIHGDRGRRRGLSRLPISTNEKYDIRNRDHQEFDQPNHNILSNACKRNRLEL